MNLKSPVDTETLSNIDEATDFWYQQLFPNQTNIICTPSKKNIYIYNKKLKRNTLCQYTKRLFSQIKCMDK